MNRLPIYITTNTRNCSISPPPHHNPTPWHSSVRSIRGLTFDDIFIPTCFNTNRTPTLPCWYNDYTGVGWIHWCMPLQQINGIRVYECFYQQAIETRSCDYPNLQRSESGFIYVFSSNHKLNSQFKSSHVQVSGRRTNIVKTKYKHRNPSQSLSQINHHSTIRRQISNRANDPTECWLAKWLNHSSAVPLHNTKTYNCVTKNSFVSRTRVKYYERFANPYPQKPIPTQNTQKFQYYPSPDSLIIKFQLSYMIIHTVTNTTCDQNLPIP